ncbi:MAG: hypothetical protein AAFY66_00955, partial [Pseudomonadota bacterium]
MPIEEARPNNDSGAGTNIPQSTEGITARAGAEERAQDIALLRRVVAHFSFSDYAQLATIAAQRPELGDTDADPEPPGQERLGPRARLSLRPARASYPEESESVPISRFAAHFSFSDYAQLATIAAQRPELGDTDADPEPPG